MVCVHNFFLHRWRGCLTRIDRRKKQIAQLQEYKSIQKNSTIHQTESLIQP